MKRLKGFSSKRSFFEMPFLIGDVTLALDRIAHTSTKSRFRFSATHTLELYRIRHKNISQLAVYRYIAQLFFFSCGSSSDNLTRTKKATYSFEVARFFKCITSPTLPLSKWRLGFPLHDWVGDEGGDSTTESY